MERADTDTRAKLKSLHCPWILSTHCEQHFAECDKIDSGRIGGLLSYGSAFTEKDRTCDVPRVTKTCTRMEWSSTAAQQTVFIFLETEQHSTRLYSSGVSEQPATLPTQTPATAGDAVLHKDLEGEHHDRARLDAGATVSTTRKMRIAGSARTNW